MKTQIKNDELLDDLHPARFLQPSDLLDRWKVQNIDVTIAEFAREDTIPNPKDLDPTTADEKNPKGKPRVVVQPVLYFKTKTGEVFPRGYLMSAKIDVESLKSATGAKTTGETIGKKIKIQIGQFRGSAVLRIDPKPVKEGK